MQLEKQERDEKEAEREALHKKKRLDDKITRRAVTLSFWENAQVFELTHSFSRSRTLITHLVVRQKPELLQNECEDIQHGKTMLPMTSKTCRDHLPGAVPRAFRSSPNVKGDIDLWKYYHRASRYPHVYQRH